MGKSLSLKNILLMQYPVILRVVLMLIITEQVECFEEISFANYPRHAFKINEVN